MARFPERYAHRVEEVIPLDHAFALIFFKNGEVKKCDVRKAAGKNAALSSVLDRKELFCQVSVQVGGYSAIW